MGIKHKTLIAFAVLLVLGGTSPVWARGGGGGGGLPRSFILSTFASLTDFDGRAAVASSTFHIVGVSVADVTIRKEIS
jgi:hypothetical protein